MMRRCIHLSKSAPRGDLPIACVISSKGQVIAEATNQVTQTGDVTRHAEIVAISAARKALKPRSLAACTLYTTVEPCPMCSFAIRETGIGRVAYAISSPVMGGISKWNVLRDFDLSNTIPEVFGSVPEVIANLLWQEATEVWRQWNPMASAIIERRGCFGFAPRSGSGELLPCIKSAQSLLSRVVSGIVRNRFG